MDRRLKVLVAGNDEESGALSGLLAEQGCELIRARDAAYATAMVLRNRPDAVILSGLLPGGGAVLVLKRIRASIHTATIPVIAITRGRDGDEAALLLHGADQCLLPPPDAAAIMAWIRQRLIGPPAAFEAPRATIRDPDRLSALAQTGLLDSPPTQPFDALTRLSARLLGVPVALVSLVDENRQFFKSQIGLPEPWASARQTPLTHSFCQWVVSGHEDLVVSDARDHAVLSSNSAIKDLGVVAYAGVPLSATSGDPIGSFCAVDTKPRSWSDDDVALLRELSRLAEACIAVSEYEHAAAQTPASRDAESEGVARSMALGAIGEGISTSADVLRLHTERFGETERKALLELVEWLGQQVVRLASVHGRIPPLV